MNIDNYLKLIVNHPDFSTIMSDKDIKAFCSKNYAVTFPMMSKISVKGSDMAPIYKWLTEKSANGVKDAPVTWNFQKFLIDENGKWENSIAPKTAPLSSKEIEHQAMEHLRTLDMQDQALKMPNQLSGGQKQRIAIAGALARHCEVLLFDEPTALLDGDTQLELVSQVQKLVKNRGITALWVTHRLEELDYSDGAFLLEGGKVTDRGNPLDLKARLLASAAVES
jgi:ABC-type polar amino acid transport system ATPase subunit